MAENKDGSVNINSLIEKVEQSSIASIQNVASGILKTINDIRSTTKDLEKLIKLDPPLTAKILKVANSAYYSTGKDIKSIEQAIVRVGMDTLNYLALGQKVKDVFDKGDIFEEYSRILLWKHCITVSLLGKLIFSKLFHEDGANIYTAGLLHNIGIIAIDQFLDEEFKEILIKSNQEQKNLITLENDAFGFNHAELGQAILDSWNLPQELVRAVGFHHNPTEVAKEYQKSTYTLFIADFLCQENGFGYCDTPSRDHTVFDECRGELGIDDDTIDMLLSELKKELIKIQEQGIF